MSEILVQTRFFRKCIAIKGIGNHRHIALFCNFSFNAVHLPFVG